MPFHQNYRAGNKLFYNLFQALDYSKQTGHHVHYEFDKQFIESISGCKKPVTISNQLIPRLMVKGLKQIREKHSKVRLALGGGTDSWTILKLCIENDIYLDEVVSGLVSLVGDVRADLEYLPAIKYAKKYEGSKIGEVKTISPTKKSLAFINERDWFKKIGGPLLPIRPMFTQTGQSLMNDPNSDFANITGLDKPSVLVKDGKPYFVIIDQNSIGEWMQIKNHYPLFFDKDNPELTVAMVYAFMDSLPGIKNDGVYDYATISDRKIKDRILDSFGMKLDKPWLNYHHLGKAKFDLNIKAQRFIKELPKIGINDYIDKWYDSMKYIHKQYKDVPYGTESDGKNVKTVGRYGQMIPILSNSFGYEDKS